jgi:hypothetical protein
MNRLIKFIDENSSGRNVLVFLILSTSIYILMLTITIPQIMAITGGIKILDMMPTGYSPKYVNELMLTLGENGRHLYLYHQIPLDMVYPLLFGISNTLIIIYLLKKAQIFNNNLIYLGIIPIIAGVMDYSENTGIIMILTDYPNNPDILSKVTNVFSVIKSTFTIMYFVVLLVLLCVLAIRRLFRAR